MASTCGCSAPGYLLTLITPQFLAPQASHVVPSVTGGAADVALKLPEPMAFLRTRRSPRAELDALLRRSILTIGPARAGDRCRGRSAERGRPRALRQ